MGPVTTRVVLDANVLFPFSLRDTLLRAAATGQFQLLWTDQILDETTRNLLKSGIVTEQQAAHLVNAMTTAFPEAMVRDYESLIEGMPNQEKDRHVAAAAVKAGAQVIVTSNLRDFQEMPAGIQAQGPDEFLINLFDLHNQEVVALLRDQANALKRPPKTFEQLLDGLAKTVPLFVKTVREPLGS
ncbi:MAG: PIN domain-containing protein [Bradymonadaceae bacterium]